MNNVRNNPWACADAEQPDMYQTSLRGDIEGNPWASNTDNLAPDIKDPNDPLEQVKLYGPNDAEFNPKFTPEVQARIRESIQAHLDLRHLN